MMTVTTADSKYSRTTVFRGPFGGAATGGIDECPLRLSKRDSEKGRGFVVTWPVSVVVSAVLSLEILLAINDPS